MKAFLRLCDLVEEVIGAFMLCLMLLITVLNVISRFVLHASFSFADEITTYSFVLLSLLGTAIAAKRREHLGLTILIDRASFRTRKVLLVAGFAIASAFSAALFYYGILMVRNQILLGQITAAMQWPEWIYGAFVPAGAFFVTIRFIQATITEAMKQEGGEQ